MRREDVWAGRAVAAAASLTTAAALAVTAFLVVSVVPVVRSGELLTILAGTWHPRSAAPRFGIAPMIAGSLALAAFALLLALPAAVGVCACAHGVVPRAVGRTAMGAIRVMTGVPTVVYGFASVFLIVPLVRDASGIGSGYSLLAAGVTLAFLVLPTIVLVLESRLAAADPQVPVTCAALGLAPVQSFTRVLLPIARRGLAAAAVLGFCRAMGDTLIALMVAGNAPQGPSSLFDSVRTLAAHVALPHVSVVNAIEIRGLRVSFAAREVLHGIDLDVPERRITVVEGPSGSGKTTLLRAVNSLNECFPACETQGEVRVRTGGALLGTEDPSRPVEDLRRRASMVFQTPSVLPFSIRRNFSVPLRASLGVPRSEVEGRMERAFRDVGLWDEVHDRLASPAADLSGGQQQRLCLARALALEPEILLADEPTANLDERSAARVEEILLGLRDRVTILAVSHSHAQAARLADRRVVVRDGRVESVTDATPAPTQH